MKKFLVSLMIVIVMGLVGSGIVVSVWAVQKGKPEAVIEKPDTTAAVVVQVLQAGLVEDRLGLTGLAEPWEAVTVSAEMNGKIEWQGVDDGDAAAKGQELIKINTTLLQAHLDQLRAEHDLAVQEFERVQQLRERGISSPQEFDRAATNREATSAVVRMAEIDAQHSVIHSEFDGVVDRVFNEAGEYVSVGKPLVRLVQVDRLKVLVGLPERDVSNFKQGDVVAITFDAIPDRKFEGHVYRIATTAEPSSRTFITEIEIPNQDGALKPGMIARVLLVRKAFPDAISIPMFSVLSRPEGRFVFVEHDAHAALRAIDVGFYQGGKVLVTRGLVSGDRLIVTGQRTLRDGEPVKVTGESAAS